MIILIRLELSSMITQIILICVGQLLTTSYSISSFWDDGIELEEADDEIARPKKEHHPTFNKFKENQFRMKEEKPGAVNRFTDTIPILKSTSVSKEANRGPKAIPIAPEVTK